MKRILIIGLMILIHFDVYASTNNSRNLKIKNDTTKFQFENSNKITEVLPNYIGFNFSHRNNQLEKSIFPEFQENVDLMNDTSSIANSSKVEIGFGIGVPEFLCMKLKYGYKYKIGFSFGYMPGMNGEHTFIPGLEFYNYYMQSLNTYYLLGVNTFLSKTDYIDKIISLYVRIGLSNINTKNIAMSYDIGPAIFYNLDDSSIRLFPCFSIIVNFKFK